MIEISIITPSAMRHLIVKNHLLSFSFTMDDMDEIFLPVLDYLVVFVLK